MKNICISPLFQLGQLVVFPAALASAGPAADIYFIYRADTVDTSDLEADVR